MSGQAFVDRLKKQFGEAICGARLESLDPWIEVTPEALVPVCTYLRDQADLRFDMLCITVVDWLETDPKKAARQSSNALGWSIIYGACPIRRAWC